MTMQPIIIADTHNAANPLLNAFAEGLVACGMSPHIWCPRYWNDEPPPRAFAVVCGLKGTHGRIARRLIKHGKPIVVLELGWLKRAMSQQQDDGGYYQVSHGGLNRIPLHACPVDRFKALGLPLRGYRKKPGKNILVLGQVPNDAQHGLTGEQLDKWLTDQIKTLRTSRKKARFVYRPHPYDIERSVDIPGIDEIQNPLTVTLDKALEQAVCAITYNSTAGVESLRQAVPVICAESAIYADVSLPAQGPKPPDASNWRNWHAVRKQFFARLAYGQWTMEEIRNGRAIESVMKQIKEF